MRKNIIVFATLLLVFTTSCYRDECEECYKSVYKELGQDAPKNLTEALAVFDFDVAHKYYACDKTYKHEWDSEKSAKELFKAESAYLLSNGELNKAFSLAAELDQNIKPALTDYSAKLIREKKYEEVTNLLISWPFEGEFVSELNDLNDDLGWKNEKYNRDRATYNGILDNLLKAAILHDDVSTIKMCIRLYEPEVKIKSRTRTPGTKASEKRWDTKYELVNSARDKAKKEVAAAGIKLD